MELEYVKFSLKTMKPDAFHVKLHFLSKRAIYNPIPLPVAPAGTGEADRVSRENKANAETDQERNNFVKRMNKRPMPKWIRIKLLEQPANATLNDALRISADHFLFFNNMRSADDITSDGLIEVQADVTEYLVSALLICLFCGLVYVGEYSEWCRVQLWFLVQCQCEFRLLRGGVMYQLFTSMVALVLLCGETLVLLFRAIIFSLQALLNNWILPSNAIEEDYLKGQKVLLTGSAGGVGSALAEKLVEHGAFLILVDREYERNRLISKQVKSKGGKCVSYVCDISQRKDVMELIDGIRRDVGTVDMIINNAGVVDGELITDLNENVFLKTFQVNVLSHFWLIKAFLPDMIARKSGHIVTVGSVVSQLAVAQLPAYCTSKAAAGALLEAVSTDLHRMGGNRGIYTTLICPGHIDTEMFRNVFIRFPSLTPTWSADRAAQGIIDAIRRKQPVAYLPRRYFFAVVLKHFLPTKVYWLMHNFLKTHHGMDTFEGKKLI
ncbi:epidermal retinol dehydrogenase 2-like [Symsagittifera roscoffensis]|uniref:epidermal retinol dehydrogenase 2-like n=1 Tax=Symsagittifera roscoffensis TaxID=84072 RepID=UPI00307C7A33